MQRRWLIAWLVALLMAPLAAPSQNRLVELNEASLAELEQLRGIGPALAERLIAERSQRRFADWADLVERAPGIRAATATRLSEAGLRIDGRPYPR